MPAPPDGDSPDVALLLALLAHQTGFLDRPSLVEVLLAWSADRSRGMADLLDVVGHLPPDVRGLLGGLADRQASIHGGAAGGLAALSGSESTIEELATRLADPDLQASLTLLASRPVAWSSGSTDLSTRAPVSDDPYATQVPDRAEAAHGSFRTSSAPGVRYRSIRFHAKGGLGAVFIAMDEELKRKVALKEIQDPHADRRADRERFVVEAEITGKLEHPGIVPVYGLGSYADGRPFYAMRFIHGDSLEDACRKHHAQPELDAGARALALRGLLRRFLDVCNAVEYAHSRGILHRDLKPGNIMVGKYGETLVVDWGLARVLSPSGRTDAAGQDEPIDPAALSGSVETMHGSVVGTPGYMSPEQAEGRVGDLGPTSDVYSLGATLYFLLTGTSPFSGGSLTEILDKVRRGDFPAPRSIAPEVPRPLDAICRKAMALSPESRYPTPRALAVDLDRWLGDEPVVALPDRLADRISRWMRRHKQATRAAALSLVIIAITAVTATILINRALNAETQARSAESAAKTEATENFRKARRTVDEFLIVVSENKELQLLPDTQAFRRQLLEKARDYYRDFVKSRSDDPSVRSDSGAAVYRLANIEREIGSREAAIKLYEEASRLLEPLAREDPGNADYQDRLASVLAGLGVLQQDAGQGPEADRSLARAATMYGTLARDHPEIAAYRDGVGRALTNLGNLQQVTGRVAEAEQSYLRAFETYERLSREIPEVADYRDRMATSLTGLGVLQRDTGRFPEAERSNARAVDIYEALVRDNPRETAYRESLGRILTNLGTVQYETGTLPKADRSLTRSVEVYESLARENPRVTAYSDGLAAALSYLGVLQMATGQGPAAEKSFLRAIGTYESLVRDNPGANGFRSGLALTLTYLGDLQQTTGRVPEAERSYGRAIETYANLSRDNPATSGYRDGLAVALLNLGALQQAAGRGAEAERTDARAVETYESLIRDNPKVDGYRKRLASALTNLGVLQRATGRFPEAERTYQRAVEAYETLGRDNPKVVDYQSGLARVLMNLGVVQQTTGRGDEAGRSYRKSVATLEALVASNPGVPALLHTLGGSLNNLAELLATELKHGESVELYRRAIELQRKAMASQPENPTFKLYLSEHYRGLAVVLRKIRRPVEAVEATRERASLWPNIANEQYDVACELAMCVPLATGAEADVIADKAVSALRAAVAAGWADASHTAHDPDLAPLRGRADFQALLRSLQDRIFPANPFR